MKFIEWLRMYLFSGKLNVSETRNCSCGKLDKYDNPYSYCSKWFSSLPPLCFLKGRSASKDCSGARLLKGTDIYLTHDESICNASSGKYYNHMMK